MNQSLNQLKTIVIEAFSSSFLIYIFDLCLRILGIYFLDISMFGDFENILIHF
jgi:hypothetical protein